MQHAALCCAPHVNWDVWNRLLHAVQQLVHLKSVPQLVPAHPTPQMLGEVLQV